MKTTKIGLFFGTFNPIHLGHLALASFICDTLELGQVWFIVSPQNPFKKNDTLLDERQRLHLVNLAIEDNPKFRASDIEFNLPKPSYTAHTLTYLKEQFPDKEFHLIIGQDNLRTFHKWFNYKAILENYKIVCYPRIQQSEKEIIDSSEFEKHPNVTLVKAPVLNISASFIRKCISENIDVKYFLPPKVERYIDESGFYKK
ncbi:MAG: nicotinate (nicotinamide) nucleotide adenylyltransferase [Luteibaculaceae bacterium]